MRIIDKRLEDLRTAQKNGTYTLCPRCGRPAMKPDLYTNALSRIADIMICDDCGQSEAKLAFIGAPDTLYEWVALQPKRPASDYKALTCAEVWERICREQYSLLSDLFRRYSYGADGHEIRLEAFERCPGLVEFWTEPYRMDFEASDGRVAITFKLTSVHVEMTGAPIRKEVKK